MREVRKGDEEGIGIPLCRRCPADVRSDGDADGPGNWQPIINIDFPLAFIYVFFLLITCDGH